jgi:GTP-binding protein
MSEFAHIRFVKSAWQPRQFVPDLGVEVAFAGRSNAGKSTAINAITGRQALARTSKTPGQTQLINFFELNAETRLVDLPGYGYAKVPARMQNHWRGLMNRYFTSRTSLAGVFLIMDARRPLGEFDEQLLALMADRPIATHMLLTKADKLNRSDGKLALNRVLRAVGAFATAQLFSAPTRVGIETAREVLAAMLEGRWEPHGHADR